MYTKQIVSERMSSSKFKKPSRDKGFEAVTLSVTRLIAVETLIQELEDALNLLQFNFNLCNIINAEVF